MESSTTAEIVSTFTERVCLDAKDLTSNWMSNLERKVRDNLSTRRSSKIGCILEVLKVNVHNVKNNVRLGNIFYVPVTVRALKPEVGVSVSATVCMILPTGIICSVANNQLKVFVASKSMDGYTIDSIEQVCKNEETGDEIKYGDEVDVILTIVQYRTDKKDFSCCGRLSKSN